jgi:hypothetical protein
MDRRYIQRIRSVKRVANQFGEKLKKAGRGKAERVRVAPWDDPPVGWINGGA